MTVFLTTHNLAEAEKLCQQAGVIRSGQLLAVGSPESLRAQQSAPRVEIRGRGFSKHVLASLRARPEVLGIEERADLLALRLQDNTDTAALVSLVVGAGAQVEEVRRENASLEEVFLALMEQEIS